MKIIHKTVRHIEWMHVCIFFIEELYEKNDAKNEEFSWLLLSYVIEKYPMKKSLDICLGFLEYANRIIEYILKGFY